jgi:hypothetical protein
MSHTQKIAHYLNELIVWGKLPGNIRIEPYLQKEIRARAIACRRHNMRKSFVRPDKKRGEHRQRRYPTVRIGLAGGLWTSKGFSYHPPIKVVRYETGLPYKVCVFGTIRHDNYDICIYDNTRYKWVEFESGDVWGPFKIHHETKLKPTVEAIWKRWNDSQALPR